MRRHRAAPSVGTGAEPVERTLGIALTLPAREGLGVAPARRTALMEEGHPAAAVAAEMLEEVELMAVLDEGRAVARGSAPAPAQAEVHLARGPARCVGGVEAGEGREGRAEAGGAARSRWSRDRHRELAPPWSGWRCTRAAGRARRARTPPPRATRSGGRRSGRPDRAAPPQRAVEPAPRGKSGATLAGLMAVVEYETQHAARIRESNPATSVGHPDLSPLEIER